MDIAYAVVALALGTAALVGASSEEVRTRRTRRMLCWLGISLNTLAGIYFIRTINMINAGPEPRAGQVVQVVEVWKSPSDGLRVMRIYWHDGSKSFERDIRPDNESEGGLNYTIGELLMRGQDRLYVQVKNPRTISSNAQRK